MTWLYRWPFTLIVAVHLETAVFAALSQPDQLPRTALQRTSSVGIMPSLVMAHGSAEILAVGELTSGE